MVFMPSFHRTACIFLMFTCLATNLQAAELGDAVVRPHIGEPLVADIELNSLIDPGSAVTVRMAHADVYKGANVGMNPVVGSVTLSVMRRDGRQFLHITSIAPVKTDALHLFLELTDGGKRNVRAVTLWLTPDPTPAQPARPVLPTAIQPAVPVPAPVAIAPVVKPVVANVAAPMPKPARVLALPSGPPAVCPAPVFSAEQIKACTVMDEKNLQLSAQIVDLEAKVKALQQAIQGFAAAPVVPPVAQIPPPPPKKKVRVEEGFPWLLTLAALLTLALLAGGVWFFLKRRKAKGSVAPTPTGSAWHTKLLARLKRKPKAEPVASPPAPTPSTE